MAGKALGYKPSVVEKARFEYSPLGKVINKGLDEDDWKEGLFHRLKNIENKTEKQLNSTENQRTEESEKNIVKQLRLKILYYFKKPWG